jgi:hypothetical protein
MGRGQSFHDNNVNKKIIGDTNVCSRVHDHKVTSALIVV